MIVLCVTLLLLHQGYTKVPVTTVQLGEPVTFTCIFPDYKMYFKHVSWYKQSAGDKLKLIVAKKEQTSPVYGPEVSASRVDLKVYEHNSSLTVLRTNQEDEGLYHCGVREFQTISWSGTYLSLKGNTLRTSNYTVVQLSSVSDPIRPGDSINLQCSIFSESDNKTCPENHNVFWFKSGSNKSHPDIIYTDGNRQDECNKTSDSQKSCIYRFSKKISSSDDDDGTYYCAVATCGEIIFGNGAKVKIDRTASFEFKVLLMTIFLVISVITNIVFICHITSRPICEGCKGKQSDTLQARHDDSFQPVNDTTEWGNDLNYAALRFSGGNPKRGKKKEELETEESVYSRVKC